MTDTQEAFGPCQYFRSAFVQRHVADVSNIITHSLRPKHKRVLEGEEFAGAEREGQINQLRQFSLRPSETRHISWTPIVVNPGVDIVVQGMVFRPTVIGVRIEIGNLKDEIVRVFINDYKRQISRPSVVGD